MKIKQFLKEYYKSYILLLLCTCIFIAVFALYGFPLKAVFYPFLLCFAVVSIFFTCDFFKKRTKHKLLEMAKQNSSQFIELPKETCMADDDYQQIIKNLQDEVRSLETSYTAKYNSMTEYYTLWAHQIKTPIASMRLTFENNDEPISRAVLSDLFRIEQYVDMVLSFLRLDSSYNDYVFKEYDVGFIVSKAVKKFANEFIVRKIALDFHVEKRMIITDEKWFSIVVEQVLSNALKYTPKGKISVYILNDELVIEDTGIGIAKSELNRIFEKGYTGYNGRSEGRASGIGLYLSKQICNRLGLKIRAESQIDAGTKIFIKLLQNRIECE